MPITFYQKNRNHLHETINVPHQRVPRHRKLKKFLLPRIIPSNISFLSRAPGCKKFHIIRLITRRAKTVRRRPIPGRLISSGGLFESSLNYIDAVGRAYIEAGHDYSDTGRAADTDETWLETAVRHCDPIYVVLVRCQAATACEINLGRRQKRRSSVSVGTISASAGCNNAPQVTSSLESRYEFPPTRGLDL